jgi:hypothetical protein
MLFFVLSTFSCVSKNTLNVCQRISTEMENLIICQTPFSVRLNVTIVQLKVQMYMLVHYIACRFN